MLLCYFLLQITRRMLFKHLLDGSIDPEDNDLLDLQQQLRSGIDKAKMMISCCKITNEPEQLTFHTNASGELLYPEFKNDVNYNEEFWKTYLKNQLSFSLIKEISDKTSNLQAHVEKMETLQEQYVKLYKMKNRKKNRRLAVQIQKKYTCPYDRCYKVYGSDVSLNLHIKLKHNGGNKTDREKLAEQICRAQIRGQQIPEMRLNLPPGYLQEFRKNFTDRRQDSQNKEKQNI